jgi:hypothetical protein
VKIVRRNPFPPYPSPPEGRDEGPWIDDLLYFRTWVAYILNSLHTDLTAAKVPAEVLVSRETLNAQDGMIDLIAIALAKTRAPKDTFWTEVTPERFSADTVLAVFGPAAANKRAAKEIDVTIRAFAHRIRQELAASGRTGLPPSRPSKVPYVTAQEAPKPPRAPREPKPREPKPPKAPKVSERPAPARAGRPPSASLMASNREDIPETEVFYEEMEEQIAGAAEEIVTPETAPLPSARPPSASARPPSASALPPPPRRRPAGSSQIPRVRELSEATLRAEREYFYSDRDGALSARGCPMERRLSNFWMYRAGMRPTGYTVPNTVLAEHKNDILLMVIPPGNLVQVFTKGALTEVFASSRTENALNIAARYSNHWRGVLPDGSIASDAKRSRLATGIYAAYYTRDGMSEMTQIGEPILEVLERDPSARGRKLANPAPLSHYLPPVGAIRSLPTRPNIDTSGAVVIRIRNPRSR